MTWLKSRRLQYLLALTALFFTTMALMRAVFFVGFSPLYNNPDFTTESLLTAWGIGLRFDLRLALLMTLPVAAACYLPLVGLLRVRLTRLATRLYVLLALAALILTYFTDFGHYAYLGDRLNVTALRFLQDFAISTQMLWESYPVIQITLLWLFLTASLFWLALQCERKLLERTPARINGKQIAIGIVVCFIVLFYALLGRVSNVNLANPIPLRWHEAFVSGNKALGALGLNPVLYFRDTLVIPATPYNQDAVDEYYPVMADYLGLTDDERSQRDYVRTRDNNQNPLALNTQEQRRPNVVFIMLESLGASRVGVYGTPHNPTPNIDAIANDGWLFKHFYVPVTGTAKTLWATFTGIPDVSPSESASRNPLTSHQRMVLNEFADYEKLYFVGGNAGWANISGLLQQSIDGLTLYEEGDWQAPNVDVWGISDLELFRESHAHLAALPQDKPFFAFIQTAGNHRPFTIPANNGDFESVELPDEELAQYGFRSTAQYNAVRLLDYNVGEYIKWAKESPYFDNTIFVFFGDHNNRITHIPHMPKFQEALGLESNHVPYIVYAPNLLEPKVFDEAVGLIDVMPSIASLVGLNYRNTTLGRDYFSPATEGDRASFVVLQEGPRPVYGMVTKEFLVRMNHDGSQATLHKLYSDDPEKNRAEEFPEIFTKLYDLARGHYETSRFLFYHNVDSE